MPTAKDKTNLSVSKVTKKKMDLFKAQSDGLSLADIFDQMWEAFENEQRRKAKKSSK